MPPVVAIPEAASSNPPPADVKGLIPDKGSPVSPEKAVAAEKPGADKEGALSAAEVMDLADVINEANKEAKDFPEALEIALRAITTKGDLAEFLEQNGQATRQKAESAPKEGEGALTEEQRQRQIAIGYDQEIGGLQIRLSQTKESPAKKTLSEKIESLIKEKNDQTGIKKNQFDGLAQLFASNEATTKFITENIENGTPLVAIEKILELAVGNGDFRQTLFLKLTESGKFTDDQIKMFRENLESQVKRKTLEKGAKITGKIGLVALIGALITIWSGLRKKEPGAG